MDKIAHDVGDIQSRLLDHRPVLHGEIRYFVREFEERRGFREYRLIQNLSRLVTEAKDQVLPNCTENMQEHLHETLRCLEAINLMTQKIQEKALEIQPNTVLQEGIEQRKAEWEDFIKRQSRLKEEVDEEHAKAVTRLSTQYSDINKDLAMFSHFS